MAPDKNLFSKIMTVFGFFMVAVFIVLGIVLMVLPVFPHLPPNLKTVFGLFFIAYGFFRLARIIQLLRQQKRKEYDDE